MLRELIGDPVADAAGLREASPVYRAADIRAAVMLVHGMEDKRVDPEHLRRMQRVLSAHGNAPVVMTFDDESHGVQERDNVAALWVGIAGFLQAHLSEAPRLAAR